MVKKGTTEQKKSHRDDTMIKNKTTQKKCRPYGT
jgi:hypothetical protein